MQVQIDIGFDQLVQIIKTLPISQLNQLKAEIEHSTKVEDMNSDLEALLLAGPVATKKQLDTIDEQKLLMAFPVATADELAFIDDKRKHTNQWK